MQKGSIVVCIDDGNWWSDSMEYFNKLPVKGELYTVREFFPNCIDPNGPPGVALEEIIGKFDEVLMHTGQLIKMELLSCILTRQVSMFLSLNVSSTCLQLRTGTSYESQMAVSDSPHCKQNWYSYTVIFLRRRNSKNDIRMGCGLKT